MLIFYLVLVGLSLQSLEDHPSTIFYLAFPGFIFFKTGIYAIVGGAVLMSVLSFAVGSGLGLVYRVLKINFFTSIYSIVAVFLCVWGILNFRTGPGDAKIISGLVFLISAILLYVHYKRVYLRKAVV